MDHEIRGGIRSHADLRREKKKKKKAQIKELNLVPAGGHRSVWQIGQLHFMNSGGKA